MWEKIYSALLIYEGMFFLYEVFAFFPPDSLFNNIYDTVMVSDLKSGVYWKVQVMDPVGLIEIFSSHSVVFIIIFK